MKMKQMNKWMLASILMLSGLTTLTSCSKDEEIIKTATEEPMVINCMKPDYLKAGDRVALISPSYFTPMENVEKTAEVVRSWGLEPVIPYGIPVLCGFPAGHGDVNLPPYGQRMQRHTLTNGQRKLLGYGIPATSRYGWATSSTIDARNAERCFRRSGSRTRTT